MSTSARPLKLTVVMYHYVRDPGDAAEAGSGIPGLPVAHFEMQLDYLTRHHVVITWPDLRDGLQGHRTFPPSACLLTFDDGVRDHYLNVFPMLRARGLSGLFFALARREAEGLALAHKIHFLLAALGLEGLRQAVWARLTPAQGELFRQAERHYQLQFDPLSLDGQINVFKSILQRDLSAEAETILGELFAQHIGSETDTAREYYLKPDQIREMGAGGMHFGGHSHSHPWFDWIGAEARADEVAASAAWLREIEPGPWAFAYPYGGLSPDAPRLLKAHGFAAAFTTVEQTMHTSPYLIGRLDGEALTVNDVTAETREGQRYA